MSADVRQATIRKNLAVHYRGVSGPSSITQEGRIRAGMAAYMMTGQDKPISLPRLKRFYGTEEPMVYIPRTQDLRLGERVLNPNKRR